MKTAGTLVGYLVAAGIGFFVGYAFKDGQGGGKPVAQAEEKSPGGDGGGAKDEDIFKVPVGDSYQKGPDDALVTIVEFSDFQCPFCGRVNPTLKKIQDEYGKDVRIVFKHNPLPFHKDAPLASEYALAAGEQGKFWEMHDKLFANQKALKPDDLDRYAKELGLDLDKVKAYVESGKGKKAIAEDQKLARQIGATGTPAFFINGANLVGAQPFPAFQRVIDDQLKRAKARVAQGTPKKKVYAELTKNGRTTPKPREPRERREPPPQVRQKITLLDRVPAKGSKNPMVTIVEFSDFQCPFCSRVNPTLDQIQKKYGDKVQIRFRNQPLSFHQQALPAAKAALAAHKQGKFWEMHDKLFANQKALMPDDLKRYAKELGLNLSKFEKDMESKEIADWVAQDQKDAGRYGARGTPTLFVNGVPIRGAQPYPNFERVIDKEIELAEKLMKEGVKRKDLHEEIIKREGGKTVDGSKPTAQRPAQPSGPVDVEIGKAPVYGDPKAPVKVVVYSDFECPFCGRVNPSIDRIKKEYGKKVMVAFKHYPLPFHKNAKPAAVASLAAHRQGKFWEMHDKLFANRTALQRDDFVRYAKELGLNVSQFEKDLDDPKLAAWVESDMAEGQKIGVTGTPATFINGVKVVGAQPYEKFESVIEEQLSKES